MFKQELNKKLGQVDTVEGERSQIMEFGEQAIERGLNHYYNILSELWLILPDKTRWENASDFLYYMKVSCISWCLQGEIPQELTLLRDEDLDKIVNYAKIDFETESRGYILDLEYQKRKLFWSEQG